MPPGRQPSTGPTPLRYHRPDPGSKPLRPHNRRKLTQQLRDLAKDLILRGFLPEQAQYLAEQRILPRFYITPFVDITREESQALLKEVVLQDLRQRYSLARVLHRYNIPRTHWRSWCETDPEFYRAFLDVQEEWGDDLEEAAFHRAIHLGSDSLLAMMLKGHRSRYRPEPPSISASSNSSSEATSNVRVHQTIENARLLLSRKLSQMAHHSRLPQGGDHGPSKESSRPDALDSKGDQAEGPGKLASGGKG